MVNCLNIKHGVAKRAHARTDSHEMATLNATKLLLLTNRWCGVRTLRHQDSSAPRHFGTKQFFVGAELSHGHFALVPNCLKKKGNSQS